jgi:hypothetical protein
MICLADVPKVPAKVSRELRRSKGGINPSCIKLTIEARDKDGKLVQKVIKESDMYLDQWGAWICGFFKYFIKQSDATTYSCKNTAGTSKTIGGATYNSPWNVTIEQNTLAMTIGTSSPTVAHTDYALTAAVAATGTPNVPVWTFSGNQHVITISEVLSPTSTPVTITEAGITITFTDSANATFTGLITHDVFTGVAVPASGTITLTYQFTFN